MLSRKSMRTVIDEVGPPFAMQMLQAFEDGFVDRPFATRSRPVHLILLTGALNKQRPIRRFGAGAGAAFLD